MQIDVNTDSAFKLCITNRTVNTKDYCAEY